VKFGGDHRFRFSMKRCRRPESKWWRVRTRLLTAKKLSYVNLGFADDDSGVGSAPLVTDYPP
jgi:hypothetical protein